MISGKQLDLLAPDPDHDWSTDDWETASDVARLMAKLAQESDTCILEPCAGSGQIVKQLEARLLKATAVEIKTERYLKGRENSKSYWINQSFFDYQATGKYDLIITNPPFSKCLDFIKKSLSLLNKNNPQSRLLFLMPLDWNCTRKNAVVWRNLDAHIHHVYRYEGRIGYLDKSGRPRKGRQCCDAVFDIRLGKEGAVTTYLDEEIKRNPTPLYFSIEPPF